MSIVIEKINIYPVKSTKGQAVPEAQVHAKGLQNDRRWMLVDHDKQFITARKFPHLLGVCAQVTGKSLHLQAPSSEPLVIDNAHADHGQTSVTVWRDKVSVQHVDARAAGVIRVGDPLTVLRAEARSR